MSHKINQYAIILLTLILFVGATAFMATAANSGFPVPPGNAFQNPNAGNSGGGSSGGSYSTPAFTPYTTPLRSSDGSIIGQFQGNDFNSVFVTAEKNGTVGNGNYDLAVSGELSSEPADDCWLNISFVAPDSSGSPPWLNGQALVEMKIAKKPGDWSYKPGSPKYTLTISGDAAKSFTADGTYYEIRYDGSNYHVQKVAANGAGSGRVSIDLSPQGDTGTFTILGPMASTPTPTPTPTFMPSVTVTPTATSLSSPGGFDPLMVFIAVLVIAAVGAGAFFFGTRFGK